MVVSDRAGDPTHEPATRAGGAGATGTGDPSDDPGRVSSGTTRGADGEVSRALVPGASGRPALPASTPAEATPAATATHAPSGKPSPSASTGATPSAPHTGTSTSTSTANSSGTSGGSGGTGGAGTTAGTNGSQGSGGSTASSPSNDPEGPSASEAQVLRIVNDERADAGCAPVRSDAELRDLARAHSADMEARDYFDHNTPEGVTPWTRAERAGVVGLGAENIARGQKSAESVMRAWMNSPGHRANILDCTLTRLGVGVEEGGQGPWWTQEFGR